jgi:capsular polysaccharide biosynthesis protein
MRWRLIFLLTFLASFLIGVYITNRLPKIYTATATIQLTYQGVMDIQAPIADGTNFPITVFQQEFLIIESPSALQSIIADLNLAKIWGLSGTESLSHLQKMLRLENIRGTNLIKITVSSDIPKEAADIANAVADRFKTMRDEEEYQRHKRGTDALEEQISEQQKIVNDSRAALGKMRPAPSTEEQNKLDRAQALLDSLKIRLKQDISDLALEQSPVLIISRAEAPATTLQPNKIRCYGITILVSAALAAIVATLVEFIFSAPAGKGHAPG